MRLENLESLLRICKDKVLIDLKGTNLQAIFKRSRYSGLLTVKDAKELSEDDKNYLFNLQESKLNQLLHFVLSQNDVNLKATKHHP